MTNSAESRLERHYRTIRALTSEEAPWPGALVSTPSGELCVRVDVRTLGCDWRGWNAGAASHILAPVDVLRRADGHDALLPACTERLEAFLARRSADGALLSAGEAVTVAVSLIRGLAELAGSDVSGSWWLTDCGRPVFATGAEPSAATEATVPLLEQLAQVVPGLSAAVACVRDGLGEPRRVGRELARAEDAAFAVADPAELATTTFGPRAARSARPSSAHEDDLEPDTPAWHHALARHVDGEWADLLSRITTDIWRRLRVQRAAGRRRPWVLAGGVAVAVVVAGALWPTVEGPATAEVTGQATRGAEQPADPGAFPDPGPGPTPTPPPASSRSPQEVPQPQPEPEPEPGDLTAISDALLEQRRGCEAVPECLAGVQEDPDALLPGGVIDRARGERSLVLLDDFGGAAVLRAEAAGAAPQLVVIVRAGDRWLLRDVHDVAQQ